MLQSDSTATVSIQEAALQALRPEMLDATACLSWLLQTLHGSTPVCPQCRRTVDAIDSFRARKRVCCKGCGKFHDYRTGTILSGTTLSPRVVYVLALLLAIGQPVREIAERLGLHEGTVRDWRDRMTILAAGLGQQG